jgi:nicotinate dehydrogenase subunit A
VVSFQLNGRQVDVDAPADAPLLGILQYDLGVAGPKYGCGLAQCGACAVLIDDEPVPACVTPLSAAAGAAVTTLEGLQANGSPSPLQQAFIDEQAAQCGYCSSGMVIQATALLKRNPSPSDQEVRAALDGNLCRCGAHNRIVRAVLRVAREA